MPGSLASRRALGLLLGCLVAAGFAPTRAAHADFTSGGAPIANTAASLTGNLVGPVGCQAGPGPTCDTISLPGTSGAQAPEDDLADALARLASTADPAVAADAVAEARAILAGDPLPGRAYSGMGLLNWAPFAKVATVPAGGTVTVNVVRTPQHTLSDTWLLNFEDPSQPYTIRYHISEAGSAPIGQLRPTPVLADAGGPIGGLMSAAVPLSTPSLPTGEMLTSRFTPAAGAPEASRSAIQEITVKMPPASLTQAVLEPGTGAGGSAPVTFAPATDEQVNAAEDQAGYDRTVPLAGQRDKLIADLAPAAPERQLWDDLATLTSLSGADLLSQGKAIATGDAGLVDEMRSRSVLPAGVAVDPKADVTVVFENNETYVSTARVHSDSGKVVVQVVNRDTVARTVRAVPFANRSEVGGDVEDWGSFAVAPAADATLGADKPGATPAQAGGSELLTVQAPGTFAVWVGDPAGGDQANAVIDVDGGADRETLRLDPADSALPVHAAFTPDGDLWVALAGLDKVARISKPGARLRDSTIAESLIPDGAYSVTSNAPPQGPTDVFADEKGLVWVTLAAGNGIARIDPSKTADGTTTGIRNYALPACTPVVCAPVFAAAPGEQPTRLPLQMEVSYDASGNALVWFTEMQADKIGLLRVAPDGTLLGQQHFSCGCKVPAGLALGADGDVWFTEGVDNRIGRLTPDPSNVMSAGAATLRHYNIPSGVPVTDPELIQGQTPVTSNPHSVIVHEGTVWFTESATGKVGRLDPSVAQPGTTKGIDEVELPQTSHGADPVPADITADRAGRLYWADEYGDAVGAIDVSGPPSAWTARKPWVPAARRSLTDSPILDPAGNLYAIESGAVLLTRFDGVGAGQPLPVAPPQVTLDLAADSLSVSGLREADTVDVTVRRGGAEVASATGVTLSAEAATVTGGAWSGSGAADALRAGDDIVLAPHGANPIAALHLVAANLTAGARADGGVDGRALLGSAPAEGAVEVVGTAARGAIDVASGNFTVAASALAGAAPRSVALLVARPGARVRTVAPVAAAPAPAPTPAPAPAPAPSPATPAATPAPGAGTPAPAAPGSGTSSTGPIGPSSGVAGTSVRAPQPAASCAKGRWLTQAAGAPSVWLLGRTAREVRACLGAPASARGTVLRYRGGLALGLRAGRVATVTVTGRSWTSSRGALRVGAGAAAVRRALPAAGRSGRTWRAVLPLAGSGAADVRVALDARGLRVVKITVRATSRAALDRAGRTLLAKAARR